MTSTLMKWLNVYMHEKAGIFYVYPKRAQKRWNGNPGHKKGRMEVQTVIRGARNNGGDKKPSTLTHPTKPSLTTSTP